MAEVSFDIPEKSDNVDALVLPGVEQRTVAEPSTDVSSPREGGKRRMTVDCKKLQQERDQLKVKPLKPVSYRRFEEFLAIERGLRESCSTLPFTVMLWVTFVVLTWLHSYVETSYQA